MYHPSFYIKVARLPSFCNPRSVFAFRGFIKSSTCEASLDRASNNLEQAEIQPILWVLCIQSKRTGRPHHGVVC